MRKVTCRLLRRPRRADRYKGSRWLSQVLAQFATDNSYQNCTSPSKCPPACREQRYEWTVLLLEEAKKAAKRSGRLQSSATKSPPGKLAPVVLEETPFATVEEMEANLVHLDVQLASLETTVIAEERAMTPSDMFNNLGGCLGPNTLPLSRLLPASRSIVQGSSWASPCSASWSSSCSPSTSSAASTGTSEESPFVPHLIHTTGFELTY